MHVQTREVDFGTVRQGEPADAEVTIGNSGDETLVIERMEFTLPGLTARLKQYIEPGETAAIQLNWDTRRLRRSVRGLMTLFLNDPDSPRMEISLKGEVVPAVEFLPRPALYLSQYTGESVSGTVTLKSNLEQPIEVAGLTPSSDRFEHRLETIQPGQTFELTVSTRPDLTPGRYNDRLMIQTNDPDYPRFNVEVNILVKPELFVSPDRVNFGTVSRKALLGSEGAAEFIRQPVVINRRHGNMRITEVTTDLPAVVSTVSPEGAAKGFVLEVGLRPELLETGSLEGSVRIATDDPENPVLIIEVQADVTD